MINGFPASFKNKQTKNKAKKPQKIQSFKNDKIKKYSIINPQIGNFMLMIIVVLAIFKFVEKIILNLFSN